MTNSGTKVTEFYLLASDGLRIVGEVENIGPGLTRDLVRHARRPARYFTACKPGMVGDGIRAPFAVTDSGADTAPRRATTAQLDQQATTPATPPTSGPDRAAGRRRPGVRRGVQGRRRRRGPRAVPARARSTGSAIEPVAESFGDLDPKIDLREADLEPGQKWTGWHRIEKDLWPARAKGYTPARRRPAARSYADDLLANTTTLDKRIRTMTFTADQIAQRLQGPARRGRRRARSPARRSTGRTPTCATSRPTSTAPGSASRACGRSCRSKNPPLDAADRTAVRRAAEAAGPAAASGPASCSTTSVDARPSVKQLSDAVNALAEPLSQLTGGRVSR